MENSHIGWEKSANFLPTSYLFLLGRDQGEQRVLEDLGGGGERGERSVRLRPRDQLPVHSPGTVDPWKDICADVFPILTNQLSS